MGGLACVGRVGLCWEGEQTVSVVNEYSGWLGFLREKQQISPDPCCGVCVCV